MTYCSKTIECVHCYVTGHVCLIPDIGSFVLKDDVETFNLHCENCQKLNSYSKKSKIYDEIKRELRVRILNELQSPGTMFAFKFNRKFGLSTKFVRGELCKINIFLGLIHHGKN